MFRVDMNTEKLLMYIVLMYKCIKCYSSARARARSREPTRETSVPLSCVATEFKINATQRFAKFPSNAKFKFTTSREIHYKIPRVYLQRVIREIVTPILSITIGKIGAEISAARRHIDKTKRENCKIYFAFTLQM